MWYPSIIHILFNGNIAVMYWKSMPSFPDICIKVWLMWDEFESSLANKSFNQYNCHNDCFLYSLQYLCKVQFEWASNGISSVTALCEIVIFNQCNSIFKDHIAESMGTPPQKIMYYVLRPTCHIYIWNSIKVCRELSFEEYLLFKGFQWTEMWKSQQNSLETVSVSWVLQHFWRENHLYCS